MLSTVAAEHWIETAFRGDPENSINVVPICEHCHRQLGMSQSGHWITLIGTEFVLLDEDMLSVVVLLDLPLIDLIRQLRQGVERVGLPEVILKTFPFDDLLKFALRIGNGYTTRALDWLEEGYPLSESIVELLADLTSIDIPQADKKRASKLSYHWQRDRLAQILSIDRDEVD